jgi:hypothetical protein
VKRVTRLLWIAVVVCVLPVAAAAQGIVIEAETFVATHDEGGSGIYITSCSAASGGLAVEGFDYPGDWIEVSLHVDANGSYADVLRSAGLYGLESTLAATVYGCGPYGEDLVSAFSTLGLGIS